MRGMNRSDEQIWRAKLKALSLAINNVSMAVLTETHLGCTEATETRLEELSRKFMFFHNEATAMGENQPATRGGIVVLISKEDYAGWTIQSTRLIEGRVSLIKAFKPIEVDGNREEKTFMCHTTLVVHNYGLDAAQFSLLEEVWTREIAVARGDPFNMFFDVLGDFNAMASDMSSIPMLSPGVVKGEGPAASGDVSPGLDVDVTGFLIEPADGESPATVDGWMRGTTEPPGMFKSRINRLFAEMIEITPTGPTHFCQATGRASYIDRAAVLLPSSYLAITGLRAVRAPDPLSLQQQGISDHTFVGYSISLNLSSHRGKIGSMTARSAPYRAGMRQANDKVEETGCLEGRCTEERRSIMKRIIHDCADYARKMLDQECDIPDCLSSMFWISAAIWEGNDERARRLMRTTAMGRKFLGMDPSGKAFLVDPKAFDELFCALRRDSLEKEMEREVELQKKIKEKKKGGMMVDKIECINRKMQLWKPRKRVVQLHSVQVTDEEASEMGWDSSESQGKEQENQAIRKHWGDIHKEAPRDEDAQFSMLSHLVGKGAIVPWNWENAVEPGEEDIGRFLKFKRDSAPGKDGIPFSAYKYGGKMCKEVLHNCAKAIMEGVLPGDDFNESISVFSS